MVEETAGGVLLLEGNLAGVGQEKREFEFADGTVPMVLMVMCRLPVRGTLRMFVVVFKLDDGGQEEHQHQEEGEAIFEFPGHFFQ
jgi:hypothetical protein